MKQDISLKTESTLIRRKKMVTLDDLANSLHCSKRTVQRRLTPLSNRSQGINVDYGPNNDGVG